MVSFIELQSEQLLVRTTEEQDRSPLITIRQTNEVYRRWRGDDFLAEFDNNLADDTTHQLTILDHDERIVGLIQFSEEDEPHYRHASLEHLSTQQSIDETEPHYRHASLKYLSTQQSIDEGTQPKQFN